MANYSILTFILDTLFLTLITYFLAIKSRKSHGIARFFSFESILILIILNSTISLKNRFYGIR